MSKIKGATQEIGATAPGAVSEAAASSSADASTLTPSSSATPLRALEDLKPLGRGITGRSIPENLSEQLALQEIMSNPALGEVLNNIKMADLRWPQTDGWVKMGWKSENVIIAIDDFKFKPK